MAVRSRRFFGPVRITVANQVVYTVPAGRTATFRKLWIANVTANAQGVYVQLVGGEGGNVFQIANNRIVPANEVWDLGGGWVLNPGESVVVSSNNLNTINAYGAGSLLMGAPA